MSAFQVDNPIAITQARPVVYDVRHDKNTCRITLLTILLMLCGALAPIKLDLIGEIYAAELLLPIIALIFHVTSHEESGSREPKFVLLLVAGFVTLSGYVLSDVIQGSRPDQFLRGWGRVGLVISNFIAFVIIFGKDKRNLWWYVLGSGVGGILYLRFGMNAPLALWKFGYAAPVLETSAALGMFVPLRVSSIWIALLGFYSMVLDFRSFAAICFLIAGYLWLRSAKPTRTISGSGPMIKFLIFGGTAVATILIALSMTSEGTSSRRAESDAGRLAAIEVGIEAVKRSPIIGHGSWFENKELSTLYLNRQAELRDLDGAVVASNQIIFSPHSQMLHAWAEGGILGVAFFAVLLLQLLRISGWTVMKRPVDALTPLILYIAISTLWDLFMSPFAASHRLGIAAGAALVVMLQIERRYSLRVEKRIAINEAQTISAISSLQGSPAPVLTARVKRVIRGRTKLRFKPERHRLVSR